MGQHDGFGGVVSAPRLLSIPAALWLGAAIHADWHLARPHDHGGLSGGMSFHWLVALPLFAFTAWYLNRRSGRPLAAGAVTIGAAVFLGQVLEPLGEIALFHDAWSDVFAAERLAAFASFMVAGIAAYGAVAWWLARRLEATGA
jgi:hypothetical protein